MADKRSRIDLQVMGLQQLRELNKETYQFKENLDKVKASVASLDGAFGPFNRSLTNIGSGAIKASEALAALNKEFEAIGKSSNAGAIGMAKAGTAADAFAKCSIDASKGVLLLDSGMQKVKTTGGELQGVMTPFNRSVNLAGSNSEKAAVQIAALEKQLLQLKASATAGQGGLVKFQNAAAQTEKSMGFAKASKDLFASAGMGAMNLSLGIVGVGLAAAKMAADFDKNLLTLRNNTTMTDREFAQMRETVLALGKETGASFDSLAKGYMHVANFAFAGADATNIMRQATMLAVATNADAEHTAQLVAKALREYGLSASHAAEVTNILWYAAANGDAKVQQFVTSGNRAFSMASQLGVSLKMSAAIMSEFTGKGLNASQATTAFTNVLMKMAHPTHQVAEELKMLKAHGVDLTSYFNTSGLAGERMAEAFQKIHDASAATGIPLKQLAVDLFPNMRGTIGALIGTSTSGLEGLNERLAAMTKYESGADSVTSKFNATLKTPAQQFAILSNKIQAEFLPVGEKFAEMLLRATPLILKLVDAVLATEKAFLAMPAPVQDVIMGLAALRIATLAMGNPFSGLIGLATRLRTVLFGVAEASTAASSSLGSGGLVGIAKKVGTGVAGYIGAGSMGGTLLAGGGVLAAGGGFGYLVNRQISGWVDEGQKEHNAAIDAAMDARDPKRYAGMDPAALKGLIAKQRDEVAGLSWSAAAQRPAQEILKAMEAGLRLAKKPRPRPGPQNVTTANPTSGDMHIEPLPGWYGAGGGSTRDAKRAAKEKADAELQELDDQIAYAKAALAKLRRNYGLPDQAAEYQRLAAPYLKQLDSASLRRAGMPPVDKDELLKMTSGLGDKGVMPSSKEQLELLRGYEKFDDAWLKYQEHFSGTGSKSAFDAAKAAQDAQRAVARAEGDEAKLLELTYSGPYFTHAAAVAKGFSGFNPLAGVDGSITSAMAWLQGMPGRNADESLEAFQKRMKLTGQGERPNNVFAGDRTSAEIAGTISQLEDARHTLAGMKSLTQTDAVKADMEKLGEVVQQLTDKLQDLKDKAAGDAFRKMVEEDSRTYSGQVRSISRRYGNRVRGQGSGSDLTEYLAKIGELADLAAAAQANFDRVSARALNSPDYQRNVDEARAQKEDAEDALRMEKANHAAELQQKASQKQIDMAENWMSPLKSGLAQNLSGKGRFQDTLLSAGDAVRTKAIDSFLGGLLDPQKVIADKQITAIAENTAAVKTLTGAYTGDPTLSGGVNSAGPGSLIGGIADLNDALKGSGTTGRTGTTGTIFGADAVATGLILAASSSGKGASGISSSLSGSIFSSSGGLGKLLGPNGAKYAQAALGAYSIFTTGQQQGVNLGNVIGGAASGAEIGSAFGPGGALIGAAAGGVLDLIGGLFHHNTSKPVTPAKDPAFYNAPSDFDYAAYRYRATGLLPTAAQLPGYGGPGPQPVTPVVNVYMGGVKQAVQSVVTQQTSIGTVAQSNSYYDAKRPI